MESSSVTGQNGWAEWDAEVVLKPEAVSGGGASMQTGNTLEWRSVASFHKQHHRRVPDIYDLRSEWQRRHDFNPESACLPYRYMAKSARPTLLFSPDENTRRCKWMSGSFALSCQSVTRGGRGGEGRESIMGKKPGPHAFQAGVFV